MSLNTITTDGRTLVLDTEVLSKLANELHGKVLTPESEGYDEARSVWNAMIDRRPAMIVRCTTVDDVVAAVRFARDHGQLVAVRGGGHNIAGNAICEGGMVIDLSEMRQVTVDPVSRTAKVEGGATLGDVDTATQRHGLATPLGINSTTGAAGLTLGGGLGWLSPKYGLTIDNLLSAEIVTAAGQRMHISEVENSDLFWGIRGGGGNFGVVTSFEFRLHPVGPEVLAGLIVHPLDEAPAVLRFYREFLETTPEEFACWFVMRQAPPLPFLAPEWHGKEILALAACWSGDIAEGERVAKPLREFGSPLADVIAPTPYAGWQTVLDPLLTPGARNYWKSHDFMKLDDGLIDVFMDHARRIPDPQTEIAFAQLGGAISRVAPDATAYVARAAKYLMNVHARWSDPARDEACIGWAKSLFEAAAPFSTGDVYVNFMTGDEADRVKATYGANYNRLARLKMQYDPNNLFRVNQNIRPA